MLTKSFFSFIVIGCMLSASATAAQPSQQRLDEKRLGETTTKIVTEIGDQRYVKRDEIGKVASTSSKPGDFARNSERYTVYLANCKSLGMTPALRDESAKKFEDMSPGEFQKQVDRCPQRSQDQADAANVQMAQNVNVDADINIGGNQAYGYGPAPRYVRPAYGRPTGGNLSGSDISNLKGIAQRALGPVPRDATNYTAHVTRTKASPAGGCQPVTQRHVGGGTFIRWRCPTGTINRLGW